jgi:predicted enzyme related to lactoylglutathione lyase
MHGQFSWYDLMTPDPAASKKFYPAVTGWGTEEWDKAAYTMWTAGGVPLGGMNPITPEQTAQGVRPHWLAYVTVDDVENSASKVKSLGGQVMHGPEDIPDVGRFAIIRDPQGAMLAIFKSATPNPGYEGTPSVGNFSWHELMATDYKRAFDFYRQLFGWESTGEMDMGPVGKYLTYGKNGKAYGGMFNRRPEHGQMPPNWTFYVTVKDLKKSLDTAKRTGGQVMLGPMDVPGGTVVVLKDSLGAPFALFEVKAATASMPTSRSKPKSKAKTAAKKKSKRAAKARGPRAGAKSKAKRGSARRAKPKAKKKARRR